MGAELIVILRRGGKKPTPLIFLISWKKAMLLWAMYGATQISRMPSVRPTRIFHPIKLRSSTNSCHLKPRVWALLMLRASMTPISGFSHRFSIAKR